MSTELTTSSPSVGFNLAALLPEKTKYEDAAKDVIVAGGGSFIPYLRFYSAATDLCKSGAFGINSYGLHTTPGDKPEVDLGKSFVAVACARRPLAVDVSGESGGRYYDPDSAEFKDLDLRSQGGGKTGALVGWEWLLYIPQVEQFATVHFNNASMKNTEATAWASSKGQFVRFSSREAKNSQHTWYTPTIVKSSDVMPITTPEEEFRATVEKFSNPISKGAQLAVTDSSATEGRAH